MAELLAADGWEVELIARNNAPGPDIIAVSSKLIDRVTLKMIVECKRWSEQHPVDIDVVRKVMYWVNEEYRATLGMIATTSRFTSAAIEQATRYHEWRLDLRSDGDPRMAGKVIWKSGYSLIQDQQLNEEMGHQNRGTCSC